MTTKPVTLRLDEAFHARLKARAEQMGTTVTALITEVTERELDEDRDAFLKAADDFNTPENWAYVQERFGPRA